MRKKQRIIDNIYKAITYSAALLSVLVLGLIILFLLKTGFSTLSFDMFTKDYWSKNILVKIDDNYNHRGNFDLHDKDGYCSMKWGICLSDEITNEKEKVSEIVYIDQNSPFNHLLDMSIGNNYLKNVNISEGYQILKYDYTKDGIKTFNGRILNQSSNETIELLDTLDSIDTIYLKSVGGGIKGSLLATLYLIIISLLISLPIGISSAIYLNEYAYKSKFNKLIRAGIETLTGVPSIVYGLMGITVLFPITQLFGINTTSILLGGLTMAIILLPTIIRSCEEALLNVPNELKDASASLGATKAQTIFKIVLPCSINGILTGVLLSVGRVIGESAALIYTMGTFINDAPTIYSQGTSLSLMIWSIMAGEQPNFELACAISLVILGVVLMLNIIVKMIVKFSNKFV